MKNFDWERVDACATQIRQWLGDAQPKIGITPGSGLGTDFLAKLADRREISYIEIGLPQPGARGHAGKLHYGKVGDVEILVLQGRSHYYEGHDLETVVLAVRALTMAGVTTHIVTCASGGVRKGLTAGDICIISDHINLTWFSPLRGENDDHAGPRFPDMTQAYDRDLMDTARRAASDINLPLERGVYAMMPGPCYETPAEVRMLTTLGADFAGMSTVLEVIAARHMGARVLGLTCVTNLAAGILDQPLSHQEVIETADRTAPQFSQLLLATIARIGAQSA